MSSQSDKVFTYGQLATVAQGYRCELCHVDSGAVFTPATAALMLKRHVKTRAHKTAAASPSRFTV